MHAEIYLISFRDGSSYVGSTTRFPERRKTHLKAARHDKYSTNSTLTRKLREHGMCCIYVVATALDRETMHEVEADVIETYRPTLNAGKPQKVHFHGDQVPGRAWGKWPSMTAAAAALGTSRSGIRRFASYEAYLANKTTRAVKSYVKHGPPDPRKNTTLANVGGAWVTRASLYAKHDITAATVKSRLERGWAIERALTSARHTQNSFSMNAVCKKYKCYQTTYRYRRNLGMTVRQALGIEPHVYPEKKARSNMNEIRLTAGGKTAFLSEWAKKLGVPKSTLFARRKHGWTPEQMVGLAPPPGALQKADRDKARAAKETEKSNSVLFSAFGVQGRISHLARVFGVPDARIRSRMRKGWTIEEAIQIEALPPSWTIEYARTQPLYQELKNPSPLKT